jgi:hypothetical protein
VALICAWPPWVAGRDLLSRAGGEELVVPALLKSLGRHRDPWGLEARERGTQSAR